ncbi:MAG: DUF4340 domain-containing protein [Blastocatellia bacterium]
MKRSTLILLAAAILLGAGAYYYEFNHGTARDEEKDTSVPAFTFKSEDVNAVTLTNAGKVVNAEKKDGKWLIIAPIVTEADQNAYNEFINDIAGLKIRDLKPASAENLKEFRLDSAPIVAEFKMKDGKSSRLAFGEKDFTGSNVYVRVDQLPNVGVIAVPLLLRAEKGLNDWRERKILTLTADTLSKIRIKNPNLTLAAEKGADGKWLAQEPAAKKGKEVTTARAIDAWISMISQEVIDQPNDEIKGRLAKPAVEIQLTDKDGKVTSLKASASVKGKEGDEVYVSVEGRPQIYRVRTSELDQMSFKLADVIPEPTPTPAPEPATPPVAAPPVTAPGPGKP